MTTDPTRCPLCSGVNGCELAAGRATCWCFETPVAADLVARVPAEAQGVACVCKACASPRSAEHERRQRALRWTKR